MRCCVIGRRALCGVVFLLAATAARAQPPELEVVPLDEDIPHATAEEPSGFPDPFESSNRKMLWFDQQMDRWFVSPVVEVYQFLVPPPARRAVRRFSLNLTSASILVNDLLQREWGDACITAERFAINSTVGIGGLFDPAAAIGIERHSSDFGQTLALAGVGSGPYLVMPLLGPTTARDAGGTVVDFFLQPMLYILPLAQLFIYEGSLSFSRGLAEREYYSEGIEALRASSVDYYSALYNAYYQTRTAQIWDRRADHRLQTATPSPTP